MPMLSQLMSSGRNYPGTQAPASLANPALPGASLAAPAVDSTAVGQTLAAFLSQSGAGDATSAPGLTRGTSPGQFTLPWGTETLHLLSTGSGDAPTPEQLIIVPQETYAQFSKARSTKAREALIQTVVQGTQAGGTLLGGAG